MESYSGNEMPVSYQWYGHERSDFCRAVLQKVKSLRRLGIDVVYYKWAAFPQCPMFFLAEIGNAVRARDVRSCVARVFAYHHEVIFICFDIGIAGAVHAQMLSKHPHGYRH